jgi:acetyl esterase/lipase
MWPLSFIDAAAGLLPTPRGVTFERVDLGGFAGEWVRPRTASAAQTAQTARATQTARRDIETSKSPDAMTPVPSTAPTAPEESGAVLYFHGGAFLACGVNTHRPSVARIVEACALPVLSVAYRQLPAVRLAGSVDDCVSVYRALLANGIPAERIVLAGDSAGGYLAFATALTARAEGLPGPAGIVALSPWLDLDCTAKLAHPNAARDSFAPVRRLPELVRLLGVNPADVAEHEQSPVNRDLKGLPPVLLMAAEAEILRCDAELMAERLAAADVPVTLKIWAGQVHAFPILAGLLPESRTALDQIGRFIRDTVAARSCAAVPTALAG